MKLHIHYSITYIANINTSRKICNFIQIIIMLKYSDD